MPSALPDGEPVPADGALPASASASLGSRPFGIYVHVPFCATRCGYCDFNTYTAAELGSAGDRASYVDAVVAELRLARRVLGDAALPVETVFVGGGTPTLLAPAALGGILRVVDSEFGLADGAEVTTEANPDTVDAGSLELLRQAGFTRLSLGMQSAVPHVLRTLDRTHDAARLPEVVGAARAAGFDSVSVDLIYGTPGESAGDWQVSLDTAVGLAPDHVSAYALVVEEGTRLAAQVRRGVVAAPDDDDLADRYLQAEETLCAAGFDWYEVSNWSRTPADRCRHNLGYWAGGDWWGAGPAAHSHVGGVRWWNVKHPAAYSARLGAGASPAHAREVLGPAAQELERLLLGLRLADGLPLAGVPAGAAAELVAEELLDKRAYDNGRAALTLRGRLLADAVVRRLTD